MLRQLPKIERHPDLLVGSETFDDAGVYRLNDDLALVQTLDFFTPIVDDPFTFGQISATNALSDVYAMGARPLTALNLVAFPKDLLDTSILTEILKGGLNKLEEAGVALVGGHTVDDPEPKYGLAVTGVVHPDKVLTNAGARAGDKLILTKPLGIGVITTALKEIELESETFDQAILAMTTLNAKASQVALSFQPNACTDITGFGFLGHLHEVTSASGLRARVYADAVPLLPQARSLADDGFICGGSKANMRHLNPHVTWSEEVDEITRVLLCDAITSGGLLFSVEAERAEELKAALDEAGPFESAIVGEILSGSAGSIEVV